MFDQNAALVARQEAPARIADLARGKTEDIAVKGSRYLGIGNRKNVQMALNQGLLPSCRSFLACFDVSANLVLLN